MASTANLLNAIEAYSTDHIGSICYDYRSVHSGAATDAEKPAASASNECILGHSGQFQT